MSKFGHLSGFAGGTNIYHHGVTSTVRIQKTYPAEVEQGVVEEVVNDDWYDYAEIKDLYNALQKAAKGNLKWLLKDE